MSFNRPKPIATFNDMATFIMDGIDGDQFAMHCPQEQVQLAAIHLLMAFSGARLYELLDSKLKGIALRYRHLKFFLGLWTEDDDEGRRDSTGSPQPQFHLYCKVYLDHVKGTTASRKKDREQPLYSHGEEACLDPVLLLAQLAELDGVFAPGVSIASIMRTTDASYFLDHDFLQIPM